MRLLPFLILVAISVGCSKAGNGSSSGVVAQGSRVLGMDTSDAAADFSFSQGYAAAQSIGVKASTLHVDWNQDEASGSGATSGTFTDAFGALFDANTFYPSTTPVSLLSLTIAPIDTGTLALPSDLSSLPMDNANVITRFNHFMDWVLAQLPNSSLTSIQIGNEIDTLTAASNPTYWSQYQTFLSAVVTHIHSARPGVKVGTTVTLYGLIGQGSNGTTAQTGIVNLASVSDEVGVTYYPLEQNFMMKDPSVVATETAAVFSTLPSTPIYFQEVGYATSSTCGSSEDNQSAFVDQIFTMWDAHASQVPFLSFVRMNDYSAASAQSVANSDGLGSNAPFVAYLQTLGFRSEPAPSSFKSGWTELQAQLQLRNWKP